MFFYDFYPFFSVFLRVFTRFHSLSATVDLPQSLPRVWIRPRQLSTLRVHFRSHFSHFWPFLAISDHFHSFFNHFHPFFNHIHPFLATFIHLQLHSFISDHFIRFFTHFWSSIAIFWPFPLIFTYFYIPDHSSKPLLPIFNHKHSLSFIILISSLIFTIFWPIFRFFLLLDTPSNVLLLWGRLILLI